MRRREVYDRKDAEREAAFCGSDDQIVRGNWQTRDVTINDAPLDPAPSQALVNHSPDGFAWGYGGSGPAQLALALLLHFTKDADWSLKHYQDFKWDMIATLPQSDFVLDDTQIARWLLKRGQFIAPPF